MYLSSLSLVNFRSHLKADYDFDPNVNLFIGPNGSGKTNILEAIYSLTGAPSFQGQKLANLVSWVSDYAIVTGTTSDGQSLEVRIKHNQTGHISKSFHIQGVTKTRKQFFGQLRAVVFQPDDIRLITGSPSRRRQYLDYFLSSIDWQYRSNLYQYQKALNQRNQLLSAISQHIAKPEQLYFWDKSLVKAADFIHKYRQSYIDFLNSYFQNHTNTDISTLEIKYIPCLTSESILNQRLTTDISTGQTSTGVHRDDLIFTNKSLKSNQSLSDFGSRGQQRIAIFAVKLGEISYIISKFSYPPLLLLDDIFSELDPVHQQSLSQLCYNHQSFISSSQDKDKSLLPSAKTFNL